MRHRQQLREAWTGIPLLAAVLLLVASGMSQEPSWFTGGLIEWVVSLQTVALVVIGISGRWRALGWGLAGAVALSALHILVAVNGLGDCSAVC